MRKSRVLVAAAGLFFFLLCLWVRVAWLQVGLHEHFVARAAQNQQQRAKLPPKRGELLDRNGVVLARDLQLSNVALYKPQVNDPAALAALLAPLLHETPKAVRARIEGIGVYGYVARELPPEIGNAIRDSLDAAKSRIPRAKDHKRADAMAANLGSITVEDETRRDYRLNQAACEIIGRTNTDDTGVDGVEFQFDRELAGRIGWVTQIRSNRHGVMTLPGAEGRPARDGASIQLTIDADLQSIVEQHLARAVDSLKAVRGFAIFLDPATGEILASACVPHLPPGKARNWTFTDMYEPGSTFKVVVAGATLEENLAKPNEYFVASETGRAELLPGVYIKDSHKHAGYTFFGAIQNSSNIVCGKLGIRLGADRLYRYATSLGFGSLTGVEFPGESPGHLRPVSAWQPRSTPTIAIGQEVAVTPLQLALAYGALANGGVLMQPVLVKEVRSADGRVLSHATPTPVRRVFSESTIRELREMLCAVVDSGTATLTRLPMLRIAGKTGTAQKYDPRVHGYGSGMYIASFAGMAPADDPRIVGVVVIDEPHSGAYYGGQIAAPVFREVMLDLLRQRESVLGRTQGTFASSAPAVPSVTAPDLRLLPPSEAEHRLADYGLHIRREGSGPRVLSQSPAAGEPVDRGAAVTVFLSPPQDSLGRSLPALAGMTVREALRQLTLRQVTARIEGQGVVVRQEPAPGTPLPIPGGVRLVCAIPDAPLHTSGTSATAASASKRRP